MLHRMNIAETGEKAIALFVRKAVSFMLVILLLCEVEIFADIPANGGFAAPYFQAEYIQNISEYSACMINPALLYRVNQMRFEAGIYRWKGYSPSGDLGFQQISFLMPIRLRHTVGASIITSGSRFDMTAIDSTSNSIINIGSSNFSESWLILHYSFWPHPRFSLGVNPKFVIQDQFSKTAFGAGMDFGAYYSIFDNYRFGDLGISACMQDVIPPNLKWQRGVDRIYKQYMTTRFRAGIRYAAWNDRIVSDAEFVLDNAFIDLWRNLLEFEETGFIDDSLKQKLDKSYLTKIARASVHLRYQWIPEIWFKIGWANNNVPYMGFNFNVIYPLPEMINYFNLDVQFGYSIMEAERGPIGVVRVSTDVGPTREQMESKRLYERLIVEPMSAYNEAMRLYKEKKYWDAAFAFGKVLSLFPNFHLNDKVTYYMGDCFTQLQLNDIARELFQNGLAEYTTSEMRASFLYGIELIDYREGKYKDALKNHAFIANLYGESDVKWDADYLAGQIHYLNKNYSAALQLLNAIPKNAGAYPYAQYTLAVINIESSREKAAEQNLVSVVMESKDKTSLIWAASVIKLGQFYYEQVDLRKAVETFLLLSSESPYYDDALVGIAWSWIKVNRPKECLSAVEKLIATIPTSSLIPEAHLLRGYALYLLSQYQPALESFHKCIELCKGSFASEQDLVEKKSSLKNFIIGFTPTSNRIKKNSLRKPVDKVVEERVELKTAYTTLEKELTNFNRFSIIVENNRKFFLRKDQLILDAEYAIAKAEKSLKKQNEQKVIQPELQKQQQIDSEIQKLQKQLNTMDSTKLKK